MSMNNLPIDEFLEKIDSPVQQTLVEQKYQFSHPYEDEKGSKKQAAVYLEMDVLRKTFKVVPGDGRTEFGFVTGSHKYNMWRATTRCISAAIEFAVETLELEQPNDQSIN
jgi:hypothetical protein